MNGLPAEAMLGMAMEEIDVKARGVYDVPRTRVAVPESLKGQVFPFLNDVLERRAHYPRIFPEPKSTDVFLDTLVWFREVFLQVCTCIYRYRDK